MGANCSKMSSRPAGWASSTAAGQLAVERPVAIKVLPAERQSVRQRTRFEREVRVLARLQHPHIVSLIDSGSTEAGQLYLVMELLTGEVLSELIARCGPLDQERVTAIATQVLQALEAAHAQGVLHRDIKPREHLHRGLRGCGRRT